MKQWRGYEMNTRIAKLERAFQRLPVRSPEDVPILVNTPCYFAFGSNDKPQDYFDNPATHIHCDLGRYERRALDDAKDVAKKILTTMGSSGVHSTSLSFSGHQIGTHRMGADSRASVVDANLVAHDVPNLYLVGSGCFVTAGASPPTLTIVALAIRAAEHIAAGLRPAGGAVDRPGT